MVSAVAADDRRAVVHSRHVVRLLVHERAAGCRRGRDIPFVTRVALAVRAGRRRSRYEPTGLRRRRGHVPDRWSARLENSKDRPGRGPPDGAGDGRAAPGDRRRGTVDCGRSESALDFDAAGIVDRGWPPFPAHLPHETDSWIPSGGRFRDERGGLRVLGGHGPSDVRPEQRRRGSAGRGNRAATGSGASGAAGFDPLTPAGNLAGRCAPAFACPLIGGPCRSGAVARPPDEDEGYDCAHLHPEAGGDRAPVARHRRDRRRARPARQPRRHAAARQAQGDLRPARRHR